MLLRFRIYKALFLIYFLPLCCFGQNFTTYFSGNSTDVVTTPNGGICLAGGATEDDNAMKWFLQRANGGDVLVLRTSGSNGYNNYLYATLGIPVNSVETIVCNNKEASFDPYVLQKIKQAEAIWFAGGDQWNYITFWRDTPVDSLINEGIEKRNMVIGGTSAGMAIQGSYYFSAQNGTVSSNTALSDPFNTLVKVDSVSFINHPNLESVITDTHFDNPNRKGRIVTFLSRIYTDYGVVGKAIACDEYTSVCIDENGIAKVFGGFPTHDDNAYFIQVNCATATQIPENCVAGSPLTWNQDGQALKVYQIKGDKNASNTFDLNTWLSGTGGLWYNWSVLNGTFSEQSGSAINCTPVSVLESQQYFSIYPNPTSDKFIVSTNRKGSNNYQITVYNSLGQKVLQFNKLQINMPVEIDLSHLENGVYKIVVTDGTQDLTQKVVLNH